jgi:protein-disulfide isomerase
MYRRFLVAFFRRAVVAFLLVCLACSAQSVSPDLARKIKRQVRATYNVPSRVKLLVGDLKPSEFPNYNSVTVTLEGGDKKREYEFLLSKDSKTLVRLTKLDLSADPDVEMAKKFGLENRPVRGKKDAKVVLVNFDDFQCPYCSRMHATLFPELLKEYGDRVSFVYKDYPLSEIHPWAKRAAINANCLAAQNGDAYWDFADYIHTHQKDVNSQKGSEEQFGALDKLALEQGTKHSLDATKLQACIKAQNDDAVKASVKEGDALGVDGTPALFVNGERVDGGALPIEELRSVLDVALEEAGVTPPVHSSAGSGSASK